MSDIVKNAVDSVIGVADTTSSAALDAIGAALDLAKVPIKIGESTAEILLAEAGELRKRFLDIIQKVADSVTEPLP